MDVLVAMGSSVAYFYSLAVTLFAGTFEEYGIATHVYYEASGAIITFILLGKYLEIRAVEADQHRAGAGRTVAKLDFLPRLRVPTPVRSLRSVFQDTAQEIQVLFHSTLHSHPPPSGGPGSRLLLTIRICH